MPNTNCFFKQKLQCTIDLTTLGIATGLLIWFVTGPSSRDIFYSHRVEKILPIEDILPKMQTFHMLCSVYKWGASGLLLGGIIDTAQYCYEYAYG